MSDLKTRLANGEKLTKEEMARLGQLEDEIMEHLRKQIAELEAKDPPLSEEDQLKLFQMKEKLLQLELDRLLRKKPLTEEDKRRIKEL